MSVWKKAAKSHQKIHKERHQPEERKHLGLLEKKKDYLKRARDYNEKKQTLKLLRKRALNKNPDEFYHHMINSKIDDDGRHFERESDDEDTPEQIQLMRSQDLKYIVTKRTQELKKIEKLQAELHLSSVDLPVKNQHIRFTKNLEPDYDPNNLDFLSHKELPDVDLESLTAATQRKKQLYMELSKRIRREQQLSITQRKIEINKHLENKKSVLPPKKLKKGDKDKAPVYVWKYERKK